MLKGFVVDLPILGNTTCIIKENKIYAKSVKGRTIKDLSKEEINILRPYLDTLVCSYNHFSEEMLECLDFVKKKLGVPPMQ